MDPTQGPPFTFALLLDEFDDPLTPPKQKNGLLHLALECDDNPPLIDVASFLMKIAGDDGTRYPGYFLQTARHVMATKLLKSARSKLGDRFDGADEQRKRFECFNGLAVPIIAFYACDGNRLRTIRERAQEKVREFMKEMLKTFLDPLHVLKLFAEDSYQKILADLQQALVYAEDVETLLYHPCTIPLFYKLIYEAVKMARAEWWMKKVQLDPLLQWSGWSKLPNLPGPIYDASNGWYHKTEEYLNAQVLKNRFVQDAMTIDQDCLRITSLCGILLSEYFEDNGSALQRLANSFLKQLCIFQEARRRQLMIPNTHTVLG